MSTHRSTLHAIETPTKYRHSGQCMHLIPCLLYLQGARTLGEEAAATTVGAAAKEVEGAEQAAHALVVNTHDEERCTLRGIERETSSLASHFLSVVCCRVLRKATVMALRSCRNPFRLDVAHAVFFSRCLQDLSVFVQGGPLPPLQPPCATSPILVRRESMGSHSWASASSPPLGRGIGGIYDSPGQPSALSQPCYKTVSPVSATFAPLAALSFCL